MVKHITGLVACLALLAAACSGSGADPDRVAAQASVNSGGQADGVSGTSGPDGRGRAGADGSNGGTAAQDGDGDGYAIEPAIVPFEPRTEVKATLVPLCITPGGSMTLSVEVQPKSSVAFQAIYSNNWSGADPPYGGGYGGNDGGFTDDTGRYLANWTVSADAPLGPARVDVYVAVSNVGQGYAGIDFRVEPPGGC